MLGSRYLSPGLKREDRVKKAKKHHTLSIMSRKEYCLKNKCERAFWHIEVTGIKIRILKSFLRDFFLPKEPAAWTKTEFNCLQVNVICGAPFNYRQRVSWETTQDPVGILSSMPILDMVMVIIEKSFLEDWTKSCG